MSFNLWSWSSKRKTMLGITSRSHENNFRWLVDFLRMNFSDVFDVKYLPITNTNRYDWEQDVRACSAVILYHTKNQGRVNITNVDGSLYDEELCYLNQRLGKEKVMVLLDDMKDISENERQRILSDQPSLKHLALHLILIPERNKFGAANRELQELFYYLSKGEKTYKMEEKSDYKHPPYSHQTSWPSSSSKNSNIKTNLKYSSSNGSSSSPIDPSIPRLSLPHSPYRVGIFSRSAQSNFTWLMDGLRADPRLRSAEINVFCITNNFQTFRSGLQQCDFAILYHTKNQGRINITDVTDALYNVELQEMSQDLGKDNVIVVIDDMESSESEVKDRILERQFSIKKYAKDLFLFTEKKKNTLNLEKIQEIIVRRCVRTSSWIEKESFGIPSWASGKCRSVKGFFNNSPGEIWTNLRKNSTSAKSKQPPHPAYRVGIFSRSAHSNFTWLIDCLKADLRLRSAEINAFSITNNSQTFRSGLQQCDFTILYHTKKQGRINITNVTDSLYDEELQEMSQYVGKGNVIVVVDDLDSVEPEVKHRILANQPKIGSFARDLFLFTETYKHTMNVAEIREIIRESLMKFEAQFSVLDTQEHPMEVHRNGESSMTDAGSSVDSLDNRTAQDKETTSASSPFSSQSDSHQKSDTAEPQSKRSKTTSNEETDSMDVKDLMEFSPYDLICVMRKKWEDSQQEKRQLRQTIKQLKEENAHQKIIIQNLTENRSQEETIKNLKGENLYQKENIKKKKNENTTVHLERETRKMFIEEERIHNMEENQENIEEKKRMILEREECADGQEEMRYEEASHEEEVQEEATGRKTSFPEKEEKAYKHKTRGLERLPKKEDLQNPAGAMSLEDLPMTELMTTLHEVIKDKDFKIQRLEQVIQRLGDEVQRKGEQIQKQGEEIYKQGEEIYKQGEEIYKQGEEIQRRAEGIQRRGEEIKGSGEEIERQGEVIQRNGKKIQKRAEEIQRKGNEIQKQAEKIKRKGEEIKKKGEAMQRVEEEIVWQGEEIHRLGEEIQKQREEIQNLQKELESQKKDILSYEFICKEILGENKWKVQ